MTDDFSQNHKEPRESKCCNLGIHIFIHATIYLAVHVLLNYLSYHFFTYSITFPGDWKADSRSGLAKEFIL